MICQYPLRVLDGGWGVGHPDHLAAGEAALAAVFPTARDHMTFPELLNEGFEPHNVAEVWIMDHPEPDVIIDVTDHMVTAVKALAEHTTQTGGRPYKELPPPNARVAPPRLRRNRDAVLGVVQADFFQAVEARGK